ncbi:MAG: tryptophan--tRNA ligase [Puniceicoccales bacterium]|jgi:tryptophanyl-tRNA synthetase|nr:tryptophan--tRNA ligase [Puniceicoccales bacterium]
MNFSVADHRPLVLTGMQPTGRLHLGNFLGAAYHWRKMLEDYQCFFFIPDLHAMTVATKAPQLQDNTLSCIAQYIACGLDPAKCTIFLQSQVTGHTELAWILGCITPLGQLERMTQFKDKALKQKEFIGTGLLYYPILMAADILLYNADLVPIGEDQKQHLELARDLAQKFNSRYSEIFNIPEPYMGSVGARIMSLQNPKEKMSKSDPSAMATLHITDENSVIRKKILSAVTDSQNDITADPERPGILNLLNIYAAATQMTLESAVEHFKDHRGYAAFKNEIADVIIALLEPIRQHYLSLREERDYLLSVIHEGAMRAQARADTMLSKVYHTVGLL